VCHRADWIIDMKSPLAHFRLATFGLAAALTLGSLCPLSQADEPAGSPAASAAKTSAAKTTAAKTTAAKAAVRPRTGFTPQDEQRFRGLPPEKLLQNRSQDVVLDQNGGFSAQLLSITTGELAPAGKMKVKLLSRGQLLAETTTDDDGKFSVTGIKPKQVVAIFASGPSGFIVYGVRTAEASEKNPATREIDVESVIVDTPNASVATELLRRSIGIRDQRFSGTVRDSDKQFPEPSGELATSLSYDSVQIAADGKLYGQINLLDDRTGLLREVLSLRVFFLKDGKVAAAGRVAGDGSFSVGGLEPGVHSFIGVGRDGIFALGIEVLPFKAADKLEDAVPVSLFASWKSPSPLSPRKTLTLATSPASSARTQGLLPVPPALPEPHPVVPPALPELHPVVPPPLPQAQAAQPDSAPPVREQGAQQADWVVPWQADWPVHSAELFLGMVGTRQTRLLHLLRPRRSSLALSL